MTARILMVDDEPDAQELFRQNFRREIRKGVYSFDFALSGEAALVVLKGQTPPRAKGNRWYYDRGPRRFLKIVVFGNGRVLSIREEM